MLIFFKNCWNGTELSAAGQELLRKDADCRKELFCGQNFSAMLPPKPWLYREFPEQDCEVFHTIPQAEHIDGQIPQRQTGKNLPAEQAVPETANNLYQRKSRI